MSFDVNEEWAAVSDHTSDAGCDAETAAEILVLLEATPHR